MIQGGVQHIFLACLLTLIVKELKISVEQRRVVTTINSNQALNIIFSVEMCSCGAVYKEVGPIFGRGGVRTPPTLITPRHPPSVLKNSPGG